MREISFVDKLKFNFAGSVTKRALVIGDADNDQCNELVCANLQGDLAIFKGRSANKFACASDLGMVTACIVGDVINSGKNHVAAINTEGWLFIFNVPAGAESAPSRATPTPATTTTTTSPPPLNSDESSSVSRAQRDQRSVQEAPVIRLTASYDQRMPANCKELLLADLDGDGQNELIVGLTDRVLRTYKWITIGPDRGKFVGLYKWEFADQIGAVSLNPSRHENCQDIIVAQPGGTYAKLECFDKKPTADANPTPDSLARLKSQPTPTPPPLQPPPPPPPSTPAGTDQMAQTDQQQQQQDVSISEADDDDNVRTEYISKLTPEYHQLALAQMRNHHISTEVLGGIRDKKNPDTHSLIVIATLDGTLMLVNKDEILWSLQVDHQLFALAMLESQTLDTPRRPKLSQSESTCTIVPNSEFAQLAAAAATAEQRAQNDNSSPPPLNSRSDSGLKGTTKTTTTTKPKKSQYFAVCAWNGKTYIIDEERNYLRFKFDEAVSAFTAGNYHFDGAHHSALVYATFNNQIILYYDILDNQIRPMYLLNEILDNPEHSDLLAKLEKLNERIRSAAGEERGEGDDKAMGSDPTQLHDLLHALLYSITDEEIGPPSP